MYFLKDFGILTLRLVIIINFCTSSGGEKLLDFLPPYHDKHSFIWGDALSVMTFHRDKMNEYLCKNYIAREIIERFQNQSLNNFDKRRGKPQRHSRLARESLLADQGSKKYKDWLSRSSTLEDIYRQFEHSEGDSLGHKEIIHEHDGEHDGEITGYAVLDSKHLYPKPDEYGGENHYYSHHIDPHYDYHHHHHHHDEEEKESDDKGLKLKELFHFALTSIAFLAFATFMIEVIMCLMEIPGYNDSDYVLVPTTTGVTAPASKIENEEPVYTRLAKNMRFNSNSLEILNAMSSKILSSIETLAILNEDDGECFQRSLCQNSKYSKTLTGPQKIWLPLWNFGMSWIGSRLSKTNYTAGNVNALKFLKAAVMGFGSKECHALHPKCDDRLRRRKRKAEPK